MDGFVDLDEAIKAEASSRLEKVEKLAGISAMALLGGAVWLAGQLWNLVCQGPQFPLTSNMH